MGGPGRAPVTQRGEEGQSCRGDGDGEHHDRPGCRPGAVLAGGAARQRPTQRNDDEDEQSELADGAQQGACRYAFGHGTPNRRILDQRRR